MKHIIIVVLTLFIVSCDGVSNSGPSLVGDNSKELQFSIEKIYEYLKNDRFILWNIADIKIGENTYYPLEQDSIDILNDLGCEYKGKLKMLMTRMVGLDPSKSGIKNAVEFEGKVYNFEPIFVFHKK